MKSISNTIPIKIKIKYKMELIQIKLTYGILKYKLEIEIRRNNLNLERNLNILMDSKKLCLKISIIILNNGWEKFLIKPNYTFCRIPSYYSKYVSNESWFTHTKHCVI